jgi:uncharacterized cupredoxin-like copper-binding protein
MSITEPPPFLDDERELVEEEPSAAWIAELRQEVRRQGRSIKASQQAFSIFAVLAVLVSGATFLAVAFKLQKNTQRVAAPAATAVAQPAVAAAALPRNVDVTLAQFAVSPRVPKARAGNVTFRAHNAGTITHEFVVIKTSKLAADLPIVKGRASEANNIGETGDVKPGQTKSVTINLAAGHYALICNLPGHYLAGQHTDFTVE